MNDARLSSPSGDPLSSSSTSSSSSSSSISYYPAYHRTPHSDPGYPQRPLEPSTLPPPPASLREAPGPDIIIPSRPTLVQFRGSEGPSVRAAKLRALWESLPSLPDVTDCPTPTERMHLPGQDTLTALSPERAERLKGLYEEELVRRCSESRPDARLWGGADDLEPEAGAKTLKGKGIAWHDFR